MSASGGSGGGSGSAESTGELLARLWKKNLGVVRERVELVERAAAAADRGAMDEALRMQAVEEAHKLAGSLGMFGHREGTELARELEAGFERGGAGGLGDVARKLRKVLPLG